MRHYSCDLCGKDLTDTASARHQLRIELTHVVPELETADLDADAVSEMAAMLDELEAQEEAGQMIAPLPAVQKWDYDLCPKCYQIYAADPLGQGRRVLRYSKN
jgi:hypothetical protein